MVNLEWFRSFVAIYRNASVSGAARNLGLTQPAVSQHLAALEAAVGEPLFLRTPRRMIPTGRGKELYGSVVQSLETLEGVDIDLARKRVPELPLVRLGSPLEFFLERVVGRLADLPLQLRVEFGLAVDLLESLRADRLDVVIRVTESRAHGHRVREALRRAVRARGEPPGEASRGGAASALAPEP